MHVFSCCNLVCAFAPVFSEKNRDFECKSCKKVVFGIFECFFLLRARALYVLARAVAKTNKKQPKALRVLLHNVTTTRKAVGVLFETHFA